MYFSGSPQSGGLNNIANRSSGNYKQSALIGKYSLGGNGDTFYNFYRIALNGTTVTGDTNLETILGVGGTEYFNLDLIAPDVAGTRTLIDMSSRHLAPQSSSGDNDVLGAVLADRMQGHIHGVGVLYGTINQGGYDSNSLQAGQFGSSILKNPKKTDSPQTDGTNGTPRKGTTTRPKEFTVGSSYIIVMIPA